MEKGKANYPLQHSGLEDSMDCIVHGVAKSLIRLNDFHFLSTKIEKSQSTPSVTLKDEIIRQLH